MKVFILTFIFLSFGLVKGAGLTSFKLVIGYDGLQDTLIAGYSDSTTNNFDENYEEEYPPFPPPSGIIIPAYRIMRYYSPVDSELIYSRYDYRAKPSQDTTVDYILDILGTRDEGREFYMQIIASNLPNTVQSIQIIDKVLDGKLIDSNIIDGKKLRIDNRFIQNFIVRVRYSMNPTSVEDGISKEQIVYFYDNNIYLNETNANRIELYNLNGEKVLDSKLNANIYNIENVPKGIYFVYIYESDVVLKILKIIKL